MSHMIEMKKVSKFYSTDHSVSTGFSKVNLNLDIGEFVVITGESGGGKSTLLNVISGLDSYEEGEMFVAGEDTSAFRTEDYERYRKTYIGNIFQDFNLVNSYTVYQNVELVLLLNGHQRSNIRPGIMKILEWVGLKSYARTKVSKLSGGQRQRVAIARAFAKNAPIIVADEPTGNLDSESAKRIMEILAAMAKDRLVIVVTHNYEQAEPYATRKIMMRDGRIIEDNVIRPAEIREFRKEEPVVEEASADEPEKVRRKKEKAAEKKKHAAEKAQARRTKLSFGSQIRLGLRNTFNLPAKFLLMLFIYMFICTAVTGEYASTMTSQHKQDMAGEVEYFFDSSPERILLHKKDRTAFTEKELKDIAALPNIKRVTRNDLSLDRAVMLDSEKIYLEGPVYQASSLKPTELAYGRLPESDREIVLGADSVADAYDTLREMGKGILGKSYYIDSFSTSQGSSGRISDTKYTVVGVTFKKAESQKINNYGYSRIYATDGFANQLLIASIAGNSTANISFQNKRVQNSGGQKVFLCRKVHKGEAFILQEDAETYYSNGVANGKEVGVKITNKYFTSQKKLKVKQTITPKNIKEVLGYPKDDYEAYTGSVFVSPADYRALYDQGDFQISAFMRDEKKSEATLASLEKMNLEPLAMKNLLSNVTADLTFASRLVNGALMLVLFMILFFIAYAVIRLIMRSRNTYYSTLRILGATQRNTKNILQVELLTVMCIAVAIVAGGIFAIRSGLVALPEIKAYLTYVRPEGAIIVLVIMLLMSLLIASRYSKRIFSKSAMNVYRGEA